MNHLPHRLSRDEALALFERPGLFSRKRPPSENPKLPLAEIIWIPHYVIPLHVVSRKGPGVMTTAVEAWSGAFALFELTREIIDRPVHGQTFPPRLTPEEATAIARRNLQTTILYQRSYGPKPLITGADPVQQLLYPFWVYYYERRRGLLDIKLLDAATGAKVGGKTKAGILEAFKSVHTGATPSQQE